MEITLGQQYSVGEKPSSTPSHMEVIIYYYMGYKYCMVFNRVP